MDTQEFVRRRARVMDAVGDDGVAVVAAAPVRYRSRDADYPYRQDSDFLYLTDFPEPEAVAVLAPGREEGAFVLFCRSRDPAMETWEGRRAGPEGARERYGADQTFPIEEIDARMPDLLAGRSRIYYPLGRDSGFDQRILGWLNQVRARVRAGVLAPDGLLSLDTLVHEMRLVKSPAELDRMRRAAQVSAAAHRRAMAACRPGRREYEIEAELLYDFHRAGGEPAYNSIVGGGANACILHYTENRSELRDGDLLLIDAGAELDGYCADITRTFPVNGRFSGEQRALYEVVLAAQQAAIDAVAPGQRARAPHEAAVRVLSEGLVELGLLDGPVDDVIDTGRYKRFYMHGTGHWLGMDVHDVGTYKTRGSWRTLLPGMVTTVEPGLYVPAGSDGVDERWWDIGIRIEDDVAVTESGHEVLSADAPKAIEEIEALMAEAGQR